jgi:hypothetical protein
MIDATTVASTLLATSNRPISGRHVGTMTNHRREIEIIQHSPDPPRNGRRTGRGHKRHASSGGAAKMRTPARGGRHSRQLCSYRPILFSSAQFSHSSAATKLLFRRSDFAAKMGCPFESAHWSTIVHRGKNLIWRALLSAERRSTLCQQGTQPGKQDGF